MDSSILVMLLSERINNKPFDSPRISPYDTPENKAIIADVVSNYEELSTSVIAKRKWILEISAMDVRMPRPMEDHIELAHNGQVGNPYGQAKYDQKKLKRANKPVK
jgi:hypothetical protein